MRLIACDLDGTLLDPSAQLSARSVAALRAAAAAGVHVVLASGRPPFMLQPVLSHVGESVTYGVLANGSVVCTLPDGTPMREVHFDLAQATGVIRQLRAADDGYGFAFATDAGFAHEDGFALDAAVGATRAVKLMVFHRDHRVHTLLDLVPSIVGPELQVSHLGADCVEVGPAGVDKATGLAWLCEHLGIDAADVVVFGDEYNDHGMLQWAGHGVAMANADSVTKALADEVTLSNADDGVAVVIERLLAERR